MSLVGAFGTDRTGPTGPWSSQVSREQVRMYLVSQPDVPWITLRCAMCRRLRHLCAAQLFGRRYIIAEVNYGGRVTDDKEVSPCSDCIPCSSSPVNPARTSGSSLQCSRATLACKPQAKKVSGACGLWGYECCSHDLGNTLCKSRRGFWRKASSLQTSKPESELQSLLMLGVRQASCKSGILDS